MADLKNLPPKELLERMVTPATRLTAEAEYYRRMELLAELTEDGTPIAISHKFWEWAEKECGHNSASARHALTTVQKYVAGLKERLKKCERAEQCEAELEARTAHLGLVRARLEQSLPGTRLSVLNLVDAVGERLKKCEALLVEVLKLDSHLGKTGGCTGGHFLTHGHANRIKESLGDAARAAVEGG